MYGVEVSQDGPRRQHRSTVEQGSVEFDLVHASELTARLGDRRRTAVLDGAHHFDMGQSAGHPFVSPMATEEPPEGLGFRFLLHELHDGGGVEVDLQRSSSRISFSWPDASMP